MGIPFCKLLIFNILHAPSVWEIRTIKRGKLDCHEGGGGGKKPDRQERNRIIWRAKPDYQERTSGLPEWKIRTRRRMRRNCRERKTRLEERAERPAGEYVQLECLFRTFHQEYSAISTFSTGISAIIRISLILRQLQKLRSRREPSVFQNNPRAFFPGMLYFR